MTDHETAARALGFKLRDCNPEGDTFAAAVADALAAERAAGRAEGARQMRERAVGVCHARVGACAAVHAFEQADVVDSVADEIEALPLEPEATS